MIRTVKVFAAILALAPLAGCDGAVETEGPHETYLRYHAMVAAGRTFEEDVAFHAEARVAEVLAALDAKAAAEGRAPAEIKALYLEATEAGAACAALTLVREAVFEKKARLVYAVRDTCARGPDQRLVVEMAFERGWKIQSDTLEIS